MTDTTADEFGRVVKPGGKTGPRELAKALGAPSRVVTHRETSSTTSTSSSE